MYQRSVLDNQLRVFTSTMEHTMSVSITLCVGAGSRYESADLSGVSHFIEHLPFKGTRNWPTAKDVSEAIEGVGGMINATTDRDILAQQPDRRGRKLDNVAALRLQPMWRGLRTRDPVQIMANREDTRIILETSADDNIQSPQGVLGYRVARRSITPCRRRSEKYLPLPGALKAASDADAKRLPSVA